MRQLYKVLFVAIFILTPQTILANAGTALMWMPIIQLMIGNIFIGIIEGVVVSLIFNTKWYRSILIMILGNYFSWLIGNGILLISQEYLIEVVFKLNGVFAAWIVSLIILYFLTVVLETPFFNWIFNKENRNWKRSWNLSFILNLFTYTTMIIIYLSVSKYSFFTELKVNQTLLDKKYNLELFIKQNNEIIKGNITNDFKGEVIYQIPEKYEYLQLDLKENVRKNNYELVISNYLGDSFIIENSFIDNSEKIYYPFLVQNFSRVKSDFRDTTNRNWNASAGGWAIDGITIRNEDETKVNYAFEVPWMFWGIGQVSIINENELIYQIYGRLVLMNKNTKEIAYITKSDNYILRKEK